MNYTVVSGAAIYTVTDGRKTSHQNKTNLSDGSLSARRPWETTQLLSPTTFEGFVPEVVL